MEIVHVYTKKRVDFGKPARFRDVPARIVRSLAAEPALAERYVEQNPRTMEVQVPPESSEHEVSTVRIPTAHRGMMHVEGGWPKDVDTAEQEHLVRYRKRVEKDENYQRQVKALGDKIEYLVQQNNAVDIYEEYFAGVTDSFSSAAPSANTLTVFRDPCAVKRTASSISWSSDNARKMCVSYSVMQFQKMPDGMSLSSYIWDLENPNFPELELCPPSPLVCSAYNPKDSNIIIGGTYNGLLALFDTRTKTSRAPTEISPIEKSHRDPVYDVSWIASKAGTDFFSCSTDGQVLWWDYRRLGEPVEKLNIEMKGEGTQLGGTALDYDTAAPTKFLVGTEQGYILLCNKKAKRAEDRIGTVFTGHHGPVYALQHNPFFPKYFLTVGDWTAKIWSEEQRTPIMTTKYHMSYLTDGAWSPTRPGVFLTARMDGVLDIWDYFFKQNDPALSMQVGDAGLFCLNIESNGRLVACGAMDGSVTLLELGSALYTPQNGEKQVLSAMLDREAKREKNLEARARELRLKDKKKGGHAADDAPAADSAAADTLAALEKEFMEALGSAEDDLHLDDVDFDETGAAASSSNGSA